MRVGIIGGGISGVYLAILLKEANKNLDVFIFEKNNKLNKKIYATGNGRCNFANSTNITNQYSNIDFIKNILDEYTYKDICEHFKKLGIESFFINNNAYPYSKTALTVGKKMEAKLLELGVNVFLDTKVLDYELTDEGINLVTDSETYFLDKIIFSCGGKSSSQFGSDGNLFPLFMNHGYRMENISPSLCPIKVRENTKLIEGLRQECVARLFYKDRLVHEEAGEVLFKKDGLSGIVIFNVTHYINCLKDKKDITIELDLLPEIDGNVSYNEYENYLHPTLAKYLLNNSLNPKELRFSFKDFYDFNFAHVTFGGVSLLDIKRSLESKVEKNVFFIGEVLDVSAVCGGYNMMWCFASANRVKNEIIKNV